MIKKERKMKNGFTRKILDDFKGLPLLFLLFSSQSSTISMILFRNVSLSRGKSTTRFGRSAFYIRKVTIFIGRETKTNILPTKINEKNSLRPASPSNNNYSLRIIYNHSTTTTTTNNTQQRSHTTTRDDAIWEGRDWIREDPLVHPYKWLRPDLVPLLHFSGASPILRLVVLECLLIRPGLMKNSERPGFPTFTVLGKGIPALRNLIVKLMGGYHFYLRLSYPG